MPEDDRQHTENNYLVMGWIGGLISGIGSLGSSILNGIFGQNAQNQANNTNLQIARETNLANKQLAEYEWNKNLEMWNLQNQYNSPAAQMQRYKAAGLNPNLIYGQGNSGNATSLPRYSAPTMQPVTVHPAVFQIGNALDVLGKYMDYRIKSAQEAQIRQQTDNMWWQQHNLWPHQSNLWQSQRDYWTNNANRLAELLPFEKRNYNSLINNRWNMFMLGADRLDFDKRKWRYEYKLLSDKFDWEKGKWKDEYKLRKDRLFLDSLNSVYKRSIDRLNYEFFRDYGVMPNTAFGSRLGLFNHIYGDDSVSQMKRYLDAEVNGMVLNSIPYFDGGFNFRGKRRKFPKLKPIKL